MNYDAGSGVSTRLPNINADDPNATPSQEGQDARERAKEVLYTLEDGKPGDADRLIGSREPTGIAKPIDWMRRKLSGGKKKKEKAKDDGVIR